VPSENWSNSETYIAERVEQYQKWYDNKSVSCKKKYLFMRCSTVVGGVLTPVLVNMNFPEILTEYKVTGSSVAALISLVVAVFLSLESVLKYKDQWKNYRSTEQLIGHEKYFYKTRVGRYAGLADDKAFSLFVERIEDAIYAENLSTLNVLTTSTSNEAQSNSSDPHNSAPK